MPSAKADGMPVFAWPRVAPARRPSPEEVNTSTPLNVIVIGAILPPGRPHPLPMHHA